MVQAAQGSEPRSIQNSHPVDSQKAGSDITSARHQLDISLLVSHRNPNVMWKTNQFTDSITEFVFAHQDDLIQDP